ncbi:MAG: hypothetical protein HC926_02915 [Synechococcaceae cyanobacterium SM2_3_60]|nr:hypothetical protein [Synechococcaceae cyanobacterium SM2_3_60]
MLRAEDVVIDLGCGPLPFGLALMAYQSWRDRGLGALHYLGVDHAPAMLRKAKAIATDLQALYPHSRFTFCRQWRDVSLSSDSGRLILNCAHILHNASVNVQALWPYCSVC